MTSVHLGSTSIVVVSADGTTVTKYYKPSSADRHADADEEKEVDGIAYALQDLQAYRTLQGGGLPALLTTHPLIKARWPELEGPDKPEGGDDTVPPFPWTRPVACMQFAYGGPSLRASIADPAVSVEGLLRAVPGALDVLVAYFHTGVIHQDIKLTNVLFDGVRLSFCGLQLATVDNFYYFMNAPPPYAYFPRDYWLYAVNHRRPGFGVETLDPGILYSDWASYDMYMQNINAMMASFGLPPALVQGNGADLAAAYGAHFGGDAVEAATPASLADRMSAVDGYMFGFTMLDFFARRGVSVDHPAAKPLALALGLFGGMVQQNVRNRIKVRDAVTRWNFYVKPELDKLLPLA